MSFKSSYYLKEGDMYCYLCESCEAWYDDECNSDYGPDLDPNTGNCWVYTVSMDISRHSWYRPRE